MAHATKRANEFIKRMMKPDEAAYRNGERIYRTVVRYQEFLACLYRNKRIAEVLFKYYACTVGEQVKAVALRLREI